MPKVTVYSTHTCSYCVMEKEYLDSKGIEYNQIFVDDDPAKASEMVERSGQMGVPVTVIITDEGKEEVVIGFQKDKINKLLGL